MKKIKKIRKEIEKWLNIPHVLFLNKAYVKEIEKKDKIIDELKTDVNFHKVNSENKDKKIFNLERMLKKEIEKCIK